jgi:hypothetical protein
MQCLNQLKDSSALRSTGWFACDEHFWTDKWISNICYGQAKTELPDGVPDNTYKSASYVAANIIWLPVERMGVGLEYLIGDREDRERRTGYCPSHSSRCSVQVLIIKSLSAQRSRSLMVVRLASLVNRELLDINLNVHDLHYRNLPF